MKRIYASSFFLLLFTFSFSLKSQKIEGQPIINFSSTEFSSRTREFIRKNWDSAVSFRNATFHKGALFNNGVFNQKTDFELADFRDEAKFLNTTFKMDVNFDADTFYSVADFQEANFKSSVSFKQTRFLDEVKYNNATFNSLADFSNAHFDTLVNFTNSEFNADVSFYLVEFANTAIFNTAEFNGDVDFTAAVLPKYLDFSFVKNKGHEIDLTLAVVPSRDTCYINLIGASVDNIKFRYKRFKLFFPDDTILSQTIILDNDLKSSVYEALLKKQKDEGYTESYEQLDIEYSVYKYTDPGFNNGIWGHIQNWVDKHWWGYGYNKKLIVLNSLLIYLFFAIVNSFFLKHLTTRVYEADKINEYWKEAKGVKLSMFFKTIPFSLFYTAEIFFGFKFDVDKLNYKENLQGLKIFNLIYFIIIYLSGLVCIAYLANYVLTV